MSSPATASSPLNNNSNLSNNSQTNNSINSIYSNSSVDTVINNGAAHNGSGMSPNRIEKPVQKVTPSRNNSSVKYQQQALSPTNGSSPLITDVKNSAGGYVKPSSPLNAPMGNNGASVNASAIKSNGTTKAGQKATRYSFFSISIFFLGVHMNFTQNSMKCFQKCVLEP